MAHHTFVSIRCQHAGEEFHLFLKDEKSGELRFFTSVDNVIGRSYRYINVRRDFCTAFEIDSEQFDLYLFEELDIDLSTETTQYSASIASLKVSEDFFYKTRAQTEEYEWVKKVDLDKVDGRLVNTHKIVVKKLRQIDIWTQLPAELLESIRILQKALSDQNL
ncbi:MAG: hypothetical protein H6569_11285 [Lewinellaceae bacterium]|nr:hypothetical protein [Lewinellaceae bacterium]